MFTSGFTNIVLKQIGGAKPSTNPVVMVIAILAPVIKSAVVMFAYNMVGPKPIETAETITLNLDL